MASLIELEFFNRTDNGRIYLVKGIINLAEYDIFQVMNDKTKRPYKDRVLLVGETNYLAKIGYEELKKIYVQKKINGFQI